MKKLACSLAILSAQALASGAFAAETVELDLAVSSDMVAVDYHLVDEVRGSLFGVGVTRNDEVDATAAAATFNVVGDAFGNPDLRSAIGVRAVVHDTFQTAGSIAVGGSFRYQPHLSPVGFETQLYYAPEVLNFNDAVQYRELLARVTFAIHSRARVFVGWTDKTIEYEGAPVDEVRINRSFNVGFTLTY